MNKTFLSAEWRYLAMCNFAVDPGVLRPLVPAGTELDFYKGTTFVSVVGFLFLQTRVLGFAVPFHRDFEEVNLRFYVRRKSTEGWRRGVVFVRELVPRLAIALVARHCYGEAYTAVPMRHNIKRTASTLKVEYAWRRDKVWESLSMNAAGTPQAVRGGSLDQFISEHYWGYTARPGGCSEYAVEHPPWNIWSPASATLDCDVSALYGDSFAACLSAPPASAFIAEGSEVTVRSSTLHRQPPPIP